MKHYIQIMKRLFTAIIFMLLLCVTAEAQKTYAVITGVSNYEGDANDLRQSTKDAKRLASLYKSKGATVVLLTSKNATRANVIAAIRKVKATANHNDHIVFSYSGHGMENYICTYTTAGSKMLSYDELFSELDKCQAKDIVCYIDACFSGSATANMNTKSFDNSKDFKKYQSWQVTLKSNPRYIVFLSSRADEYSAESPLVGSGFLTNGVVKGLQGKADSNEDKNITVIELFKYVHKDVQLHNKKQHPQLVTSKVLYDNVLMSW